MIKKKLAVMMTVLVVMTGTVSCNTAKEESVEPTSAATATATEQQENTDATYLKTYFDIELADQISAEDFTKALAAVSSTTEATVTGDVTYLNALKAAMSAAEFEELVLSYPTEKVTKSLSDNNITQTVEDTYSAYLAAAIDSGFLTQEEGIEAAKNETLTKTEAETLLMKVAQANGLARNYLAESNDPEIYAKINQAWNSFILYDDTALTEIGKNAVQDKTVTGYNLKNDAYNANFLPELTLQYGHSDIKHAHQLIALLNSEDIVAKVQLEPKVSIYEYLLEWGDIPETTSTYEVKKYSDDLYLVYAVEYDLKLEFSSTDDLNAFNEVIETYAKKNEGNEDAEGLIYASWWQPLYSTTNMEVSTEDYKEIGDYVIQDGIYSLHTFYLLENEDTLKSSLGKLAGDLTVTTERRMVNNAFYNYLTGDDYQ